MSQDTSIGWVNFLFLVFFLVIAGYLADHSLFFSGCGSPPLSVRKGYTNASPPLAKDPRGRIVWEELARRSQVGGRGGNFMEASIVEGSCLIKIGLELAMIGGKDPLLCLLR